MLDIKLIREKHSIIEENLKKRNLDSRLVDNFLDVDNKLLKLKKEVDELRHRRNTLSLEINKLKKDKRQDEVEEKIAEAKKIPEKIKQGEIRLKVVEKEWRDLLFNLPNIIEKDVPVGKSEKDNKVVRKVGKIPKFKFKIKDHVELGEGLDIIDLKKASEVSGARFYYLKNEAVLLSLALQKFALDFLGKKKFKLIEPPFMLRKKPYEGVISLQDFADMLYKIQDEDLYLIATSEHSVAPFFMNEILKEKQLPERFVAVSPCFRKEAGSHGKDTKGIFRVHQFNKVEEFIFCTEKQAEKEMKLLLQNAEIIYKKLKIPYRIVNICSSELGTIAAKKYDIEAWFPIQQKYREVVSCSNCKDYQARRLNIKYQTKKGMQYVHTLNSTAIAISRTIAAILENFQQKDGSIKIPTVLQKYCGIKKIEPKKRN